MLAVALGALAACSTSTAGSPLATTVTSTAVTSTTVTPTTVTATAVTATTVAPTTVTSTTVTPTTVTPTTVTPTTVTATTVTPTTVTSAVSRPADFLGEETIGTSVEGRPIVASHRGTAGGTVVLVVGAIHGNEHAGIAILDDLRTMVLPPGIDLWLIDAINPDGVAHDVRGNAHGVDLNRNFPHAWSKLGTPGDWQYSGPGPASEPETQAFMAFIQRVQPALTLWYHQDLNRISPTTGPDAPLRKRYALLTGLPYLTVSGGTYTGVASTWVKVTVPKSMSFIVELGPTLTSQQALVHAGAVLDIAARV